MKTPSNVEGPKTERIKRMCAVCGKRMNIILYADQTYRAGHYFGKMPLYRKAELSKALKAGTRKVRIAGHILDVLKKDPKPYKHEEYWECPKCYWRR